jgi:hypothetical protein
MIDFNSYQQANDLLPDRKRTTENVSFLRGMLMSFDRLWKQFLSFVRGADNVTGAVKWVAGTYTQYTQVYYEPTGEVFEVTVASTTTEPTTSTDWYRVNESFIGNVEAQNFTAGVLSLTYALNRRFGTSFNYPPALSEIYIETLPNLALSFIVSGDDASSSISYSEHSDTYILNASSIGTNDYDFVIKIPASIWPTFTSGDETDQMIRNFVDKYVAGGMRYYVETY